MKAQTFTSKKLVNGTENKLGPLSQINRILTMYLADTLLEGPLPVH